MSRKIKQYIVAVLSLLVACAAIAQNSQVEANEPTATEVTKAHSIAILKAPEPSFYAMENKSHVGGLIHFFRNNALGSNLSMDFLRLKPNLAELINQDVSTQLKAKNISLSASPKVNINPEKPWKLDYSLLSKHDKPVLFVYVESIGVKSQRNEEAYKPFIYLVFCLITPKYTNDCTEFGRSSFGDGADEDSEEGWSITNTREEQWRNADEVYANLPEINQAYRRVLPRMTTWLVNYVTNYLDSDAYKKITEKYAKTQE